MDDEQQADIAGQNTLSGQFEDGGLALKLERLKLDRQIASIEFLLKRRELNAKKNKGWMDILANPLTLAVVGGFLTLMTTTITGHFSASQSIDAETTKARQALQADLIKKFVENPNPQSVRANLQFLVDVGLVPSYADSLRAFLDKNPNSALPNSFTPGTSGLQYIHTDDDAIDLVMRFEGGFVDVPGDLGGPTNFGITLATLSDYLGKSASKDDIRNLSANVARDIYKKRYLVGGASGLASVQVKAAYLGIAVLSGPPRAVKFFQVATGKIDNLPVSQDGVLGPVTLQRINAIEPDLMIETVNCEAAKFYESLSIFKQFGQRMIQRLRAFSPVTLRGICPELQTGSSVGDMTPSKP